MTIPLDRRQAILDLGYYGISNPRVTPSPHPEIPAPRSPQAEWCPVCHTMHPNPGEKTDAGTLTRPCPRLPKGDSRNVVRHQLAVEARFLAAYGTHPSQDPRNPLSLGQ